MKYLELVIESHKLRWFVVICGLTTFSHQRIAHLIVLILNMKCEKLKIKHYLFGFNLLFLDQFSLVFLDRLIRMRLGRKFTNIMVFTRFNCRALVLVLFIMEEVPIEA